MNRHSDIQIDAQLIGRYLAGEARPDEALAIDRWRALLPENNNTFETIVRLWDGASEKHEYRNANIENEWLKLKKAVERRHNEPTTSIFQRIPVQWKAAAAIVLIFCTAILTYLFWPISGIPAYEKPILSAETIRRTTLKDSSVITLARHSSLSVHHLFAKTGREVKLDGEGFFMVKQRNLEPFTVHTGGIEIIVLGTQFNVVNKPKTVTVSVKNGKIRMQQDSSGISVVAGSTGIFNKSTGKFTCYADSLNRNSYSYATQELYFYNASLEEVKEALQRTYGVKIIFEQKALRVLRINTQFKKQPLAYVLKVISASLGIEYRRKGDVIYFFKDESH